MPEATTFIKDAQSMRNINWEDCVLLLQIGERSLSLGLYKRDVSYFFRLMTCRLEEAESGQQRIEEIKHILEENEIAYKSCFKVEIIVNTPSYTVVPNELYHPEKRGEYFEFLFGKAGNKEIQVDDLKEEEAKLVYAVDRDLLQFVRTDFKRYSISHEEKVLRESLADGPAHGSGLYLTLHPGFVSVSVLVDGKLQLMQPYPIITGLDVVYLVLKAKKTLHLSEDVPVYLLGEHAETDFILEKLQAEFHSLYWLSRPEGAQYPTEIKELPPHSFYHLVSLMVCESLEENLAEEE